MTPTTESQTRTASIPGAVKKDWEALQQALATVEPVIPVLLTLSSEEIRAKIAEDGPFGNSVGILADLCEKYAPNSPFVQKITQ